MRSREVDVGVGQQQLDRRSVVGSSCMKRVNSRPSSALVPTMSGTRCAVPSPSPRPGPRAGSRCRRSGPTGNAPACPSCRGRSARSSASTSSAGVADIKAAAPSPVEAPEQPAKCSANARPHSGGRTIPLAGLSEMAWAKRPLASGTASKRRDGVRTRALAEDGDVVGIAAEDRDVVAHPLQRHARGHAGTGCPSIGFSAVDSADRSMQPSAPSR